MVPSKKTNYSDDNDNVLSRREANRVSAMKSRARRKQLQQETEEKLSRLEAENLALRRKISQYENLIQFQDLEIKRFHETLRCLNRSEPVTTLPPAKLSPLPQVEEANRTPLSDGGHFDTQSDGSSSHGTHSTSNPYDNTSSVTNVEKQTFSNPQFSNIIIPPANPVFGKSLPTPGLQGLSEVPSFNQPTFTGQIPSIPQFTQQSQGFSSNFIPKPSITMGSAEVSKSFLAPIGEPLGSRSGSFLSHFAFISLLFMVLPVFIFSMIPHANFSFSSGSTPNLRLGTDTNSISHDEALVIENDSLIEEIASKALIVLPPKLGSESIASVAQMTGGAFIELID